MNVLDRGFVELVDKMGSDLRICEAARVSTGTTADKGNEKNRKLIRYLYKNEHLSPFEKVVLEFHVKCPIFVARQWFRHRTMSFNEQSARYKKFEWECYHPEEWRTQDIENKQGALEEEFDILKRYGIDLVNRDLVDTYDSCQDFYDTSLAEGMAREQARIVMPVGQYTEFFMTVNLRNLFHFLELRMHEHAQWEIRQYANVICDIIKSIDDLKFSVEIFQEMQAIKYAVQRLVNEYEDLTSLPKQIDNIFLDFTT